MTTEDNVKSIEMIQNQGQIAANVVIDFSYHYFDFESICFRWLIFNQFFEYLVVSMYECIIFVFILMVVDVQESL